MKTGRLPKLARILRCGIPEALGLLSLAYNRTQRVEMAEVTRGQFYDAMAIFIDERAESDRLLEAMIRAELADDVGGENVEIRGNAEQIGRLKLYRDKAKAAGIASGKKRTRSQPPGSENRTPGLAAANPGPTPGQPATNPPLLLSPKAFSEPYETEPSGVGGGVDLNPPDPDRALPPPPPVFSISDRMPPKVDSTMAALVESEYRAAMAQRGWSAPPKWTLNDRLCLGDIAAAAGPGWIDVLRTYWATDSEYYDSRGYDLKTAKADLGKLKRAHDRRSSPAISDPEPLVWENGGADWEAWRARKREREGSRKEKRE